MKRPSGAVRRLTALVPYHWGDLRRAAAQALGALTYVTPRKALNLALCEREKQRREARPRSRPYLAVIDAANLCGLRCPYCPTGCRRDSGRRTRLIDVDMVRGLLDELDRDLISANLFNWGEPFLHPRLAEIVSLCHDRGVYTNVSTNLNIRRPDRINDVCDAGLDYLLVSVSGATQPTYEQYHRGGRLELVLENLDRVLTRRRRGNRPGPIVEFKYLVFRHNEHEVSEARSLARRLGVDIFRAEPGGGPPESRGRGRTAPREGVQKSVCHQLWHTAVLDADGGIPPCCYLYFRSDDFAGFEAGRMMDARNNQAFVAARRLFDPGALACLPPNLSHPCLKCHHVHRQPHLKDWLAANPHAAPGHRTGGF